MSSTMSLEDYIRDSRITSFTLCDDNSLLVPINECEGYSIDEVISWLKRESIDVLYSKENSVCSMKFVGESAIDALLLIQMNLNDNFEELIAHSIELEFYEISSVTRSYREASDKITSAVDKLKYKKSFSETFTPENHSIPEKNKIKE